MQVWRKLENLKETYTVTGRICRTPHISSNLEKRLEPCTRGRRGSTTTHCTTVPVTKAPSLKLNWCKVSFVCFFLCQHAAAGHILVSFFWKERKIPRAQFRCAHRNDEGKKRAKIRQHYTRGLTVKKNIKWVKLRPLCLVTPAPTFFFFKAISRSSDSSARGAPGYSLTASAFRIRASQRSEPSGFQNCHARTHARVPFPQLTNGHRKKINKNKTPKTHIHTKKSRGLTNGTTRKPHKTRALSIL